jgi:hypothetical protein
MNLDIKRLVRIRRSSHRFTGDRGDGVKGIGAKFRSLAARLHRHVSGSDRARFCFDEVEDLVGGCIIENQDKEDLKKAINLMLLEGMMRAFAELQTIRANKDKELARLDRDRPYENFARALWHGYRHLFPKVAGRLGYDIRFLFKQDATFDNKLPEFVARHGNHLISTDIGGFMKAQRARWQNDLSLFRNDHVEHRQDDVAANVERFYDPQGAESVFNSVWRTIAELLSMFLESRFTATVSIRRTPP